MGLIKQFILVSVFMLIPQVAYADSVIPCGGDGPQPFENVQGSIASVQLVHTSGSVKEYLYWENDEALIYRNSSNQILKKHLGSQQIKLVGRSGIPLVRLMDSNERYLITHKGGWVLDTQTPHQWKHLQMESLGTLPLYWERNRLFYFEDARGSMGTQYLGVYEYQADDNNVVKRCQLKSTMGKKYHVAQGHSYPYVFLYRAVNTLRGVRLSHHAINVEDCSFQTTKVYKYLFGEAVRKVVRYEAINSYVIEFDNPSQNLLWDGGNECMFYHVNHPNIMIASYHEPIVATWNDGKGLKLYHLKNKKMLGYFTNYKLTGIRQHDLWMSHKENRFFMSAINPYDGRRWLATVLVDELMSPIK